MHLLNFLAHLIVSLSFANDGGVFWQRQCNTFPLTIPKSASLEEGVDRLRHWAQDPHETRQFVAFYFLATGTWLVPPQPPAAVTPLDPTPLIPWTEDLSAEVLRLSVGKNPKRKRVLAVQIRPQALLERMALQLNNRLLADDDFALIAALCTPTPSDIAAIDHKMATIIPSNLGFVEHLLICPQLMVSSIGGGANTTGRAHSMKAQDIDHHLVRWQTALQQMRAQTFSSVREAQLYFTATFNSLQPHTTHLFTK